MFKIIAFLALLAVASAGHGTKPVTYTAKALGANEIPTPVNSKTTASIKFTIDNMGNITGTVSIKGVVDFTAAHLHIGTAAQNGPIALVVWFPQPVTQPLTGSFSFPWVTSLNNIVTGTAADFLTALNNGGIYFNIHTKANPGGQGRAQVMKSGGSHKLM